MVERYEFVMNEAEFIAFEMICDRDKYAYGYHVNSTEEYEEYMIVMDEDILNAVRKALEIYIDKFDFDYEREVREANLNDELVCISAHDLRIYETAKRIYNNVEV